MLSCLQLFGFWGSEMFLMLARVQSNKNPKQIPSPLNKNPQNPQKQQQKTPNEIQNREKKQ